jgi:hypothetical protein
MESLKKRSSLKTYLQTFRTLFVPHEGSGFGAFGSILSILNRTIRKMGMPKSRIWYAYTRTRCAPIRREHPKMPLETISFQRAICQRLRYRKTVFLFTSRLILATGERGSGRPVPAKSRIGVRHWEGVDVSGECSPGMCSISVMVSFSSNATPYEQRSTMSRA